MSKLDNQLQPGESEMDQVEAPPLKVIGLFLGLTIVAILYVGLWSVILS
ncbi:hypothetical protein [Fredinandcohnia sp. FSL W7-1320]